MHICALSGSKSSLSQEDRDFPEKFKKRLFKMGDDFEGPRKKLRIEVFSILMSHLSGLTSRKLYGAYISDLDSPPNYKKAGFSSFEEFLEYCCQARQMRRAVIDGQWTYFAEINEKSADIQKMISGQKKNKKRRKPNFSTSFVHPSYTMRSKTPFGMVSFNTASHNRSFQPSTNSPYRTPSRNVTTVRTIGRVGTPDGKSLFRVPPAKKPNLESNPFQRTVRNIFQPSDPNRYSTKTVTSSMTGRPKFAEPKKAATPSISTITSAMSIANVYDKLTEMLKDGPVPLDEVSDEFEKTYNLKIDPVGLFCKSWETLISTTFKGKLEVCNNNAQLKNYSGAPRPKFPSHSKVPSLKNELIDKVSSPITTPKKSPEKPLQNIPVEPVFSLPPLKPSSLQIEVGKSNGCEEKPTLVSGSRLLESATIFSKTPAFTTLKNSLVFAKSRNERQNLANDQKAQVQLQRHLESHKQNYAKDTEERLFVVDDEKAKSTSLQAVSESVTSKKAEKTLYERFHKVPKSEAENPTTPVFRLPPMTAEYAPRKSSSNSNSPITSIPHNYYNITVRGTENETKCIMKQVEEQMGKFSILEKESREIKKRTSPHMSESLAYAMDAPIDESDI
ncbi:unnamed protein product [Caenorhabditis auriculariae]|uniref:HTH OST-type domain-containing protein n=1 Tax=Caenorhabditis auriculariae TaxID=2777116 RepID=A0A8S1H0V0_9PELO|nr:unnamed protein product [Caenorhabditis auriculariae]